MIFQTFGNIIAYGIIHITGYTTYKGWRWIYIIERSITAVADIVSWFAIIDLSGSPRNVFLIPKQTSYVKAHLRKDRGDEVPEKINWGFVGRTMLDWRVWSFAFLYISAGITVYSFIYFLPIILQDGLGYSQEETFLLGSPPMVFSVIEAWDISFLVD